MDELAGAAEPFDLTYFFATLVYSGLLDAKGQLELRVNGVTEISLSNAHLNILGSQECSKVGCICGGTLLEVTTTTDVDDWYIWDDSGAWNNHFLGDMRVLSISPNADTNMSDFDPVSGDLGYSMINDDSPDDDMTYIFAESALTPGSPPSGSSEFGIQNLPNGISHVAGVSVFTRAKKTDSSDVEIFTSIISDVSSASGIPHDLAESYGYHIDLYEYDPFAIANFTRDGFNSSLVSVNVEFPAGIGSPGGSSPEELWTPDNITTAAWYDYSDSSTLTLVSGAISQVNDKSGNARTGVQTTASKRPALQSSIQNGLDVARHDGAGDLIDFISTSAGIARNIQGLSIFSVFNRTGGDSIGLVYNASSGSATTSIRSCIGYDNPSTATFGAGRRLDSDSGQSHIGPTASGWLIGSAEYDYANAELYVGTDGVVSARGGFQTAGSTSDTNSLSVVSGSIDTTIPANRFGGDVGEIIVVQEILSVDDRQRVEGYLAHKWGLESLLPGSHPYKSSPPMV
jgi:hypothetical protein